MTIGIAVAIIIPALILLAMAAAMRAPESDLRSSIKEHKDHLRSGLEEMTEKRPRVFNTEYDWLLWYLEKQKKKMRHAAVFEVKSDPQDEVHRVVITALDIDLAPIRTAVVVLPSEGVTDAYAAPRNAALIVKTLVETVDSILYRRAQPNQTDFV